MPGISASLPHRRPFSAPSWLLLLAYAKLGCVSQHEPATHQPNVATRHAPTSAASSAPPAQTTLPGSSPAEQAALAFEPPARLRLPSTLHNGERVPLLLVLHGFGVSSSLLIAKANLNLIADQKMFAYLAPEGARDKLGRPFWNAGKSCCDLDHSQIDDVKRLRELLESNLGNASLDTQRVFVIGYSNGGFMAQRLACEVGAQLAGVVSVAGAAPGPDLACAQSTALAFLEIHGDADPIVHYAGGTVFDRSDMAAHSSAPDTAQYWAKHLSCGSAPHDVSALDLEPHVPGAETSVQRYDGCRGSVELWTVKGGGHYVALQPPALEAIWSFVQTHPKGGG